MDSEEPKTRSGGFLKTTIVSGLIGIAVTVIGAVIVGKLQSKEPHLSYTVLTSIPFSGPTNVVSIYQVSIVNDGKTEIDDVSWFTRIPGGKVEQYKSSIPPSIPSTESAAADSVKVAIASLNPREGATLSVLASGASALPSRPEVSLRGKGIVAVENDPVNGGTQEKTPPWVFLTTLIAGSAVSAMGLAGTLLRRIITGRVRQAAVMEQICRSHGMHVEASRYATHKGNLLYREEADRITDDALQEQTQEAIGKAARVLATLASLPQVAEESRAVVLFDLARLEAARGNADHAKTYLETGRLVNQKVVEDRRKDTPILPDVDGHKREPMQ